MLTSFFRTRSWSWLAVLSLLIGLAGVRQAAAVVTFEFQYADAAGTGFNDPNHPEYKTALVAAGQRMGSYFAHTATVVMTVTSTNEPDNAEAAQAGSGIVSPSGKNGFFRTVVQAKVISNGASDPNGSAPDGVVMVNLGTNFQYDPDAPLGVNQIDFQAVMVHEFTHAFGFISYLDNPPSADPALYTIFDSFLTDSGGSPLIDPNTFAFDPGKINTLTGGNNTLKTTPGAAGEFFNGGSARNNNGGKLVPIYSPNPYQPGSNSNHTDDNTQATHGEIMNASHTTSATAGATMTRTYSAIEAGMMTDLGYTLASSHAAFFAGEGALQNKVYYLSFPNGDYFGYYSYLSDPRYFYHFDLGYEYWFNAADGKSGVYLYDFASDHYFYTSPTFPFPYLYDFNLKTVLYYYPDPNVNNPGRYNTKGVRYFYNFATKTVIPL